MSSYHMNKLERRHNIDLNGDGYIGGEGYIGMLERITGRDINGDYRIGRPHDVVPRRAQGGMGYPMMSYHGQQSHGHSGRRRHFF